MHQPGMMLGERLSRLSSCKGVCSTRVACFCVEADEKFAGERNADNHLFLSGRQELVAEFGKAFVVACSGAGDEEEDRADTGATSPNAPLAFVLPTVVSERGQADELGDGFIGVGADLWQFGMQPGDGPSGNAF